MVHPYNRRLSEFIAPFDLCIPGKNLQGGIYSAMASTEMFNCFGCG
jgi:hypothetical protein